MIHAELLSRQYGIPSSKKTDNGAFYAVRDLSFHVRRGEVMGLLGPNGAGKSTTMKMLTCFLPPSSGDATINGVPLKDDVRIRQQLGYLPEQAPLYTDLDVHAHLAFIASMQGLPKATAADRIREMARLCGLESVLNRRIDELSKGFRQRVGLAASMLHDPVCLILDEPTTGLDPNQIVEIRHLIRRLGEEKTVLLSSHVLSEVEAVCDRVMIISDGQLRSIGTTDELYRAASGESRLRLVLRGDVSRFTTAIRSQHSTCSVEAEVAATGDDVYQLMLSCSDPSVHLGELAFQAAVSAGAVLLEMQPQSTSLEDVFHQMTGGRS